MSNDSRKMKLLRGIPSVDEVMNASKALASDFPRARLVDAVRDVLAKLREAVLDGSCGEEDLTADAVARRLDETVKLRSRPAFLRVVNATGVILHTGLGRGVYADEAVDALNRHVRGYTRIAYDLETGRRTPRENPVRAMLCKLSGAESAQVVNNNAAATLITLKAVAEGREVICSRGQLVEIGGSFRIPDVMEMGGAKLHEVGATNKTHLRDYENAINENTAALLRVHTSNYKIHGFTQEVSLADMVALGRKHGLPVIDDLGSGTFFSMDRVGLVDETVVSDSIRIGSDLVCFSTDKLMSGPQGGAIVGKSKYVDLIRSDPLMRALRVDKMTLIVLEATLRILMDPEKVWERNPTYRMLLLTPKELDRRARALRRKLAWLNDRCDLAVEDDFSQVGGGATPVTDFPTRVVSVRPKEFSAGELAVRLRRCEVPVCTRVKAGAVLMDPRTIFDGEEALLVKGFRSVFSADPPTARGNE
jgi:L-seryl-tRNA(Ser) seleniumtransferase